MFWSFEFISLGFIEDLDIGVWDISINGVFFRAFCGTLLKLLLLLREFIHAYL